MNTTNVPMLDRARTAPQGDVHTWDQQEEGLIHLDGTVRGCPQATMSVSHNCVLYYATVSDKQLKTTASNRRFPSGEDGARRMGRCPSCSPSPMGPAQSWLPTQQEEATSPHEDPVATLQRTLSHQPPHLQPA